jgi:hypothetical protein
VTLDLRQRYGIVVQGGALVMPVLHGRMEYADLVRRAISEGVADAVAVELPDTLTDPVLAAADRLPQLSILLYEDEEGTPVYLPIEPAEATVEAVRSAREAGLPVRLVDLDVDYPIRDVQRFPDTYALMRIGPAAYHDAWLEARSESDVSDQDRRREAAMAHRVQIMLTRHERVLVVCGMAHAARLVEDLGQSQAAPFARRRREGIGLFNADPGNLAEVMTTFPFLAAVYESRRHGRPDEPASESLDPPRQRAVTDLLSVVQGGDEPPPSDNAAMDAAVDYVARRCDTDDGLLDRQRVHLELCRRAAHRYRMRTGDEVHRWQTSVLQRFSRNYALIEGRLLPDFYQLVVAGRGAVDENFGYELWELGEHYPFQRETAEIPTIRVTGDQLMLGTRRIQLRRRIPRAKRRMVRVPLRKRKREAHPGEWLEGFDPQGLCSYPPEDIVIEDYGNYLRRKGVKVGGEEQSRTEPFTTSLLDGIDIRETLRHWHDGRIHVREDRQVSGGVGAVVLIFDEDDSPSTGEERYPFQMTWLGEHDQESDMAFYSTDLLGHVVGPGINRCEYGGMMLSYPPLRLFDVWEDPDYQDARSRAEVLLMAAVDYSLEQHVVYAAASPPRSALRTYAERRGRKIVYVPIAQLSPTSLKKIRVFHVLWGKDKRGMAKDYVW